MSDVIELTVVPERFERWLAGRPLAERSRREYARNVRAYCAWLEQTPDREGWQGDPLSDRLARDHAARDYRRYLQVERRAAASTVKLALALDALYRCLGLGARTCAVRSPRSPRRARWTRTGSAGCCAPRRPHRSGRARW